MPACSTSWMRCAGFQAGWIVCVMGPAVAARGEDPFRDQIVPFIKAYCSECHNGDRSEAELNLLKYDTAESAAEDFRQWEHVLTFVEREEMPPESAETQPSAAQRAAILKTLRTVLADEAKKVAGDPGLVLPRRLSNAEYDDTVRDLTGVDIHPTRSFPVDPAAGEGFDNTGEALTMTPALFGKLYGAAQFVADHALLTTEGLAFAPYPVATFADRMKFYEQAILKFYEQHKVDYESYLTACWEFRHRPADRLSATIDDWARERRLSPKYLHSVNDMLQGDSDSDGYYVSWLRRRWHDIPAPADPSSPTATVEVRTAIQQLARDISELSRQLCPREAEAIIANAGNGPVEHLARRRKTAAERDTFDPQRISPVRRLSQDFRNLDREPVVRVVITAVPSGVEPDAEGGYVHLKSLNFSTAPNDSYQPNDEKRNIPLRKLLADHAPDQLARLNFGKHPLGEDVDAETCVLAAPGTWEIEVPAKAFGDLREVRFFADAELDRHNTKSGCLKISLSPGTAARVAPTVIVDPAHPTAQDIARSGAAFCRVFPNRFFFVDETRGLSAGFHLIEGVFRDDQPLRRHVLSEDQNRELDRLWRELDFVTGMTEQMLRGFVFFERSERNFLKHPDFDPFKEEDPKLVEADTLLRFERVYLDRSNVKAPLDELGQHPIHIFFEQIRHGLSFRQDQLRRAEPIYLRNLEAFAHAAYRRPLSVEELADLRSFFQDVSGQPDQGVEQAVRSSLIRILVSPHVCCRIDPSPAGETVQPLGDLALASRLSYFLWASMPDAELRAVAEAGRLQDESVLLAQTRRMLRDDKVTGFAREFFGQWLGYRDFLQAEAVDRTVFPDFDESLKQAMFEEPTRMASHLIQTDAPVMQLLDADRTILNQRLARHYDLPFAGSRDDWAPVSGLHERGRSGILGMGVFLTRNSQPQRTSPVKRGFWTVHKVLGEHIPAPPADVVALPAKETDTNGKTIRELLALHVADNKCARCHQRFDAMGLAMEGFDPIGRRRAKDLAGRPVDDTVSLPDGLEARGVPEFARHLVQNRREDFVRTLCRKLLGYALGRSLQLSDEILLDEMRVALDRNQDRFVPLLETVVLSRQFRQQRCRDFSMAHFRTQNSKESRP